MINPEKTVDGSEDAKIELQLTVTEANLILAALAELPFKVSFALIQKIKQQGEQQAAKAREKLAVPGSALSEPAKE
jgi:hypothetical protein